MFKNIGQLLFFMKEVEKIYENPEKIKKIVSFIKKTPFEKLKKHFHYEYSLLEKGTDERELKRVYPKVEKIKLVFLRRRKTKDGKVLENYDFHYFLEKHKRAVISINFNQEPPLLLNGFLAFTDVKKFKKSLRKRFKFN